ncbi:MAG: HNH endonuclease [Thermodesulfobacteriota bacterium]
MKEYENFAAIDEEAIRHERNKARDLRRSRWWQQKLAQGLCYYCGRKVKPSELTMDHLVPIARGGQSSKGNVVTTCKECNNRKKSMLPIEWEEYMEELARRKE